LKKHPKRESIDTIDMMNALFEREEKEREKEERVKEKALEAKTQKIVYERAAEAKVQWSKKLLLEKERIAEQVK